MALGVVHRVGLGGADAEEVVPLAVGVVSAGVSGMLAGIRPVAESFIEGFSGMAEVPDEIGLEFGVSLSADANLVVASRRAGELSWPVPLVNRRPVRGTVRSPLIQCRGSSRASWPQCAALGRDLGYLARAVRPRKALAALVTPQAAITMMMKSKPCW